MKILFIYAGFALGAKSSTFPIIAALTPKNYDIEVEEGTKENINFDKHYDLVAISTITCCAFDAYEIADEFRRRGVFVIIGGWHPSALPYEAKVHADAVFVGEAEDTWPEFLKDFEEGNIKEFYIAVKPVDPSVVRKPRYDIYPENTEFGILASRGCPYKCKFCAVSTSKFGNVYRKRPVDHVIEEIKSLSMNKFTFQDSSMTIDVNYTKEIFKQMKNLNTHFWAMGNIKGLVKDDELLRLAAEAGCIGWFIGFESINQKSLIGVNKPNKVDDYLQGIKKIRDNGMMIMGGFVFGFDSDTIDVFDKTDDFLRKSEIDVVELGILTPYPGTPLFASLDKEGRILTREWSKYDHDYVVFQPKNMSVEELYENVQRIRKNYFKTSRCMIRIIKSIRFGFNSLQFLTRETILLKNYYSLSRKGLNLYVKGFKKSMF
jgi:radical SAM superfamily enzyme YgiQ (UPF0313 family)